MIADEFFMIQRLLAPDYGRPECLYLADPARAPGFAGNGPWRLQAGEEICGDTFLNAFYPDFWGRESSIGRLGFHAIVTNARATLALVAVLQDESTVTLKITTGVGQLILWLDDLPDDTSRVFVRVTAGDDTLLLDMGWMTDTAPLQEVSLSVGLCTFNREKHLATTLGALARQLDEGLPVRSVWVVNQGSRFCDPELQARIEDCGATVIEQANLGGSGGFARGMLEAIEAEDPSSHHVIMDDDIVLDPRMLERVVMFLRHCRADLALGGQMLELENPTRLHEAGGRMHPHYFVEAVARGLDCTSLEARRLFGSMPEIHYNAWWFCVIPIRVIRDLGLPQPFFIRGDDIEYGCRMRTAGIRTVPLPGCVVWHESFEHKTADWLLYYVVRNWVLISMLHPRIARPPDALYLLGFLMSVLFQHRYRATEMMVMALEDALDDLHKALGPNSASRHKRLMEKMVALPAPKRLAADNLPEVDLGAFRPLDPSVRAMVIMCVRSFVGQHLVRVLPWRRPLWFPHMPEAPAVGARDFVAGVDPDQKEFALYRSDLRQLWRLVFRVASVCLRYLRERDVQSKAVPGKLKRLCTPVAWRRAFQTPRD
jgi:galactofuranosylgalactofuranosylrhamnosyl-N-acetylglucosaminyl-diphospho-decaprenol beta-1,5/1,6-galactofuranosyltransferase